MADLNNDIEKYRQGELTPAEMHALEKRALYDPFLADALEGAAMVSAEDLSKDVAALNEKIASKRRSVFTPLRIAAGVVIVAAITFFAIWSQPEQQKLSKLEQQESPAPQQVDSVKEAEPAAATQADVTANVPTTNEQLNLAEKKIARKKDGDDAQPPVIDIPQAEEPVAGITKEDTATIAANTDRQLTRMAVTKEQLKTAEEEVADTSEDAQLLSEVVVSSKPIKRTDTDGPLVKSAEPVGGIKAYNKYLEDNLRYPAQALESKVKGRVVVEFNVGIEGQVGDFHVVKSLGHGCDEEVIRLVKDGPAWIAGTEDNVPVESSVRVRMKFDPAKAGGKN